MKKVLLSLLIVLPFLLFTGCFRLKRVSYIQGEAANNANSKVKDKSTKAYANTKPELIFNAGKISYITMWNYNNKTNKNSKIVLITSFKSIKEFDEYIQLIKKESDSIMKIIDKQGYTKKDLDNAVHQNNQLLDIVNKIEIPKEIIKTETGKYYAKKYAKDELEGLIVLRNELLRNKAKSLLGMTKMLKFKITTLEKGAIPTKENTFNYSRQGLLDEEGY